MSFVVLGLYIYYRYNYEFSYFNLSLIPQVYYLDSLFLYPIFTLTILLKNLTTSVNRPIKNGFVSDEPLKEAGVDLYKREKYAKELAAKINNTYSREALAVGINGEWGIGKTSFLNLLKRHLDKNSLLYVDFNPWGSIDKENVVTNFFNSLNQATKVYSPRLSLLFKDYSKSLADISESGFIKSSVEIINKSMSEPLQNNFLEINNILHNLNKRIVIFIDDLDRLEKDEIIQVIKLIRNTANFTNTIFVVAYDKSYISNAIKDLQGVRNNNFLEKIFQVEIDLPYIDSSIIRKRLVELLKNTLDDRFNLLIQQLYSQHTSTNFLPIEDYLRTLRDVTRFINLFTFQFHQVQDEVDFVDYFNISMLKLKFPRLVGFLYENQDNLFTKASDELSKMYLKIEENKTELKKQLEARQSDFTISIDDIRLFDDSVRLIFGQPVTSSREDEEKLRFEMIFYKERSINSVVFPNTFYRYFSNQIFSFDISDSEWYDSFKLSYSDFVLRLKEWVKQGARKEIYLRLRMVKDFKTKDSFEKIVLSIFELSNYTVKSDESPTNAWFSYDDLFYKLYNGNEIINDYYSGNKEDYIDFLKSILSNKDFHYSYTVGFIYFICNDPNHYRSFPIPQYELIQFNIEYLKNELIKVEALDKDTWSLFYDCKITEIADDGRVLHTIPVEAKQVLIDFFKLKGIDYFLQEIAIRPHGDRYFISDGINAIFQPIDDVITYVNQYCTSPLVDEFKLFFQKCKEEEFQNYIKFDFKHLKIIK